MILRKEKILGSNTYSCWLLNGGWAIGCTVYTDFLGKKQRFSMSTPNIHISEITIWDLSTSFWSRTSSKSWTNLSPFVRLSQSNQIVMYYRLLEIRSEIRCSPRVTKTKIGSTAMFASADISPNIYAEHVDSLIAFLFKLYLLNKRYGSTLLFSPMFIWWMIIKKHFRGFKLSTIKRDFRK